MSVANNLLIFLIDIIISMYAGAVLIRLILAYHRANFYNPISQFLVSITNPVILPLRKILVSIGPIDTASWMLVFALQGFRIFSLGQLNGIDIGVANLLIATSLHILSSIISILIYAILIRAIFSWFQNPYSDQNPLLEILYCITEPLLKPARKIIPPINMIDLSAFFVMILLYSLQIIIRSI